MPYEQKYIKNTLPRLRKDAIDLTVVEFRSSGFTPIITAPLFGLSSRNTLFPLGPPRHNDLRLCRIGKDRGEYVAFVNAISFAIVLRYRPHLRRWGAYVRGFNISNTPSEKGTRTFTTSFFNLAMPLFRRAF